MFANLTRRKLQLLSGPLLLAVLSACAHFPDAGLAPVQSPNDEREYRLLTLENQMQVLLISDPDTLKAAASLDVNVGSGDNPEGRGGLAHFLEHMLFLGTDKYPDAAEYAEFVTEHGGNRNAYTSFEHTNYFFDINATYLPEALDRFAQFFIAPRFDAQYVDREKNAVEAEYQMGLKSDGRRALDVLQEVMNPEHPFSQFSVGSLESLADRPGSAIRDELLSFYDKYYSANMMRLVVLGSE
jgi:insulysin